MKQFLGVIIIMLVSMTLIGQRANATFAYNSSVIATLTVTGAAGDTLQVVGTACAIGPRSGNEALAQRRAEALAARLVELGFVVEQVSSLVCESRGSSCWQATGLGRNPFGTVTNESTLPELGQQLTDIEASEQFVNSVDDSAQANINTVDGFTLGRSVNVSTIEAKPLAIQEDSVAVAPLKSIAEAKAEAMDKVLTTAGVSPHCDCAFPTEHTKETLLSWRRKALRKRGQRPGVEYTDECLNPCILACTMLEAALPGTLGNVDVEHTAPTQVKAKPAKGKTKSKRKGFVPKRKTAKEVVRDAYMGFLTWTGLSCLI
jgi:hypothetical protein